MASVFRLARVDESAESAINQVARDIEQAVARLSATDAIREELATRVTPKRLLFIRRAPVLVPAGQVWHLGVFLLASDATLLEAGLTTRAVNPGHPNYQSLSGEDRRGYRAAALRGGYSPNDVVNFDATPIELTPVSLRASSGRLFLHEGGALVRWRAGADANSSVEFGTYLRERVDLLVDPPGGV